MVTAVQKSTPVKPVKLSFREQMHLAREDAIVSAVNRLLAEKGFEAMTVDEVAAEVGIAKASLYKHFPSKEDLAAAAMVRVMDRARAFLDTLDTTRAPLELKGELESLAEKVPVHRIRSSHWMPQTPPHPASFSSPPLPGKRTTRSSPLESARWIGPSNSRTPR